MLAGGGVLVRAACLGVVVIAVTLTEPGSDDVGDSAVPSANALVLHSKPSKSKWWAVVEIVVIATPTGTLLCNCC